ncbi:MAG: peptidylprolyl isomerase [Planctomycetota bacterium]
MARRLLPGLLLLALTGLLALPAGAGDPPPFKLENPTDPVAVIKTSKGDVYVELFAKDAPKTVENFLGLAEGTKPYKDPKTRKEVKGHYYDGTIFHRVIKDFMIQGGDPLGTGTGGPGYQFEDEIDAKALGLDKMKAVDTSDPNRPKPHPWLMVRSQKDFQRMVVMPAFKALGIKTPQEAQARQDDIKKRIAELTLFDVYSALGYKYKEGASAHKLVKGVLAMANSGANTNGSQFFIDLKDTDWLTGKHTVFGKVVKGLDVVEAIGNVKVGQGAKPVEDVKILSIRRWTPDAK